MESAQRRVRSWCEECEAWHPRGEHLARAAPEHDVDLRAEPRPVSHTPETSRGSAWLQIALFLFVILPVGVVAWSAAVYAVLLLWPHVKAAFA
jgi:hypothetical protein